MSPLTRPATTLRACKFPLAMRDRLHREAHRLSPKQRRDVDGALASMAQTPAV